jgi:putative ABC transport system ATP-binding protein
MNILEIKNLKKNFAMENQVIPVIRGINLTVAEGEFIALVGPSGCGKSTFLNLVAGLESPTEGEIWFQDHRLMFHHESESCKFRRLHIGFIFQFFYLLPTMNVLENVIFPLLLLGQSEKSAKEQAYIYLEKVEMLHRKNHMPSQLSGGEQQRVAVARALIHQPKLILADEPTGNLDSVSGNRVLTLFRELIRDLKHTVIMVTHSHEATHTADRILRMRDGEFQL